MEFPIQPAGLHALPKYQRHHRRHLKVKSAIPWHGALSVNHEAVPVRSRLRCVKWVYSTSLVVEFIDLWLTTRQVCHVRPQAQRAGKVYPTCGFTCAATLTSSPTSKRNAPTLDPLVKSFQQLSLSDYSPGTHHSPQQPSRTDRHSIPYGQHNSHGHSQSPRGITRTQSAPTDRHRLSQVHHPLKCVVCFLLPSSSLSLKIHPSDFPK